MPTADTEKKYVNLPGVTALPPEDSAEPEAAEESNAPAVANAHNDPDDELHEMVPEAVAAQAAQAEEASGKGTISQNAEKIAKMLRDSFSDRVSITDVGSGNESGNIKIKAPEGEFEIVGSSAAGDEGIFLLNGELISMGAPANNSFISKNSRLGELFSKYGKGTLAESTANTDSAKEAAEEELSPLLKAAGEKQKNSPQPDYSKPKKKKVLAERVTTKLKSTDIAATNGINKSKPAKGAWKNAGSMSTISEADEALESETEKPKAEKKLKTGSWKNAKAMDTISEEPELKEPKGVTQADLDMTEEEFFKDYAEQPKAEKKAAAAGKKEEKKKEEKKGGRSRAEILKNKLIDQYKTEKGEKKDEGGKKKKEGKIEKAAKFGSLLSEVASGIDNSKSIEDNAKGAEAAFKKVYGGGDKKEEKKPDEEKKKEEEKKPEEDKKEPAEKKEVAKAADSAVDEIVKKDDKEGGSEEKTEKVVKEVAKEAEKAPEKKEEAEEKKKETKQEKADRLVGEAAAALHDRAVEIANGNGITKDADAPAKASGVLGKTGRGGDSDEKKEEEKKGEEKKDEDKKDEDKKNEDKKAEDKKDEKKEEETPLPLKEMATDLAAGYNNTLGAVSSLYSARRSKSRRTKVQQRFRGAQHIASALGNASGLAGTLLGSGKVGTGDAIRIAGGTLTAASGGMQVLSNVLGIIGDKKAKKHAKQISDKTGALAKSDKYGDAKAASADVAKVKSLKEKADPERYEKALAAAKKKRDAAKANKLAMGIASKFNKNKTNTSTKGIGGIIGGAGKIWEGVANATNIAGAGFIKSVLSPVIKKGTSIAQEKLDERDKKNAEKEKAKDDSLRIETIKEYLEGKREKIKAQAKSLSQSSDLADDEKAAMSDELTDAEADKIALARLGVDVSDMSGDKPASDAEMMQGFEKVIMKRANNILRSYNKDEMLDALMLSHDATAEDIAKALKGE